MQVAERQPIDTYAKDELRLYAENTSELYPQFQAIVRNVKAKIRRGTYDATKAPALWMHWVDAAAKRYAREFGGQWSGMFNRATREELARELAVDKYREIMRGEYGEVRGGGAYSNPMTTAQEAGLIVGGIGALALIGYAVFGGSSAKAATSGSTAPTQGGGSAAPPAGPPLGSKSATGTWVPATSLQQGRTYRASADIADALTSLGFTVYTDHDAVPTDWPSSDLDPSRWRIEGVWSGPTTPLPATLPADFKLFELQVSPLTLGGGSWQPVTTLTQGKTYRASIDLKGDASALGFQVWDQYDTLPSDWDASDKGPNRWRVQGVWSKPTSPVDPNSIAASLEQLGVSAAEALALAVGVRVWELQP